MMNKVISFALTSVMLSSLSASGSLVDVSEKFNVFVSGDFSAHGDAVHGRAAVKGNVSITNNGDGGYSFGQDVSRKEFTLISGGNVNLNASGSVFNGGIYADGNVTNSGVTIHGDVVAESYKGSLQPSYQFISNYGYTNPVDFNKETGELLAASQEYYIMKESGIAKNENGTLTLTGTHNEGLTVFNLSASDIENMNTLIIDIADNEKAVVNVSGKNIIGSKGYGVKAAQNKNFDLFGNLLFNFYEAESITLQTSFAGSILAMNADVSYVHPYSIYGSGEFNGDLFAKSYKGKLQFHDYSYNPPEPPHVPEASTVSFLLTGLLGLIPVIRRKIRE